MDSLASMMWTLLRSTSGDLRKCCSDNRSPAMSPSESTPRHTFDSAEMGVIAHLYRGEVYRSTIWRTRLDNTTNWSIVTMGIALSTAFSSPGSLAAAAAARRAPDCRIPRHGGAALSLFQCLARPRSLVGDEFLRADLHWRGA